MVLGVVAVLLAVGVESVGAEETSPPIWDCNRIPGPTAEELSLFLNAFCHEQMAWAHDSKARLAGPVVDDVYYGMHGPIWAQVYYSPHVYTWLLDDRPADRPLADGPATQRLYFIASHLRVNDLPIENWVLTVADAERTVPGAPNE
jgi:hypothetical protein